MTRGVGVQGLLIKKLRLNDFVRFVRLEKQQESLNFQDRLDILYPLGIITGLRSFAGVCKRAEPKEICYEVRWTFSYCY